MIAAVPLLYSQDSTSGKPESNISASSTAVTKDSVNPHSATDTSTDIINQLQPPSILEVFSAGKVIWGIIFFIVGFYIIRLITKILEVFAERSTRYRIAIKSLIPIVRIFGWILILYIIIAEVFNF